MAQRKTLTEAQLALLKWIGDGCPAGVMPDDDLSYRISAAALRRRGLATISGRGDSWEASLTADGRAYIDQADGPDPPIPRQGNVPVTQELVDDVIAAGGSRRFPRKDWMRNPRAVDYANRARLAETYGKVPDGKRLAVELVSPDEIKISLVDAPKRPEVELGSVPVPGRVTRYHPVVRRFRDEDERHEVSRAVLPRATRILQGLLVEAERRGFRVQTAVPEKDASNQYGADRWTGPRDGHVVLDVDGHSESLRISEKGLTSRAYWMQQNRTYEGLGRWKTAPFAEYEKGGTGKLVIEITGYGAGRSTWADGKVATLEDGLPEILAEVKRRAIEAEERRQEAARREAERERQWHAAMERAKARWLESHKGEIMAKEASRWREAELIRAYCDAAEEAHGDAEGTREWVAWGRRYAESIDPLQRPPRTPTPPETIRRDELRPFLDGWSPYEPGGRW